MGRITGALSGLILVIFLLTAFPCMGEDVGMHAKIRTFMMPQYREKDERLQFIVYGASADNKGALLFLTDMVVDFISNDIHDVKQVTLMPEMTPYTLTNAPSATRKFWSKLPHSQGLIFSESATLDKTTKILRSDRPVQFRSEFLDVNGVGFDAYQEQRLLHIRSNVTMKLRTDRGSGKSRKAKKSSSSRKSATDYLNEKD